MPLNRLVASRGPAVVTFASENGTVQLYSRGSIVVDAPKEQNDIVSDAFGPLRKALVTQRASCRFQPIGEVEGLASVLPYGAAAVGSSIMGAAGDQSLLIQPLDTTQKQITFHAAGIDQMPNLRFSARDTLFAGEIGFQMVGKNNTAVGTANRLFTKATNTLASNYYDPTKLLVQPYKLSWRDQQVSITLTQDSQTTAQIDLDGSGDAAAIQTAFNALTPNNDVTMAGDWSSGFVMTFNANGAENAPTGAIVDGMPAGSSVLVTTVQTGDGSNPAIFLIELSPWGSFETAEGASVNFSMTTNDRLSDSAGLWDIVFSTLSVQLQAQPVGITMDQLLDASTIDGAFSIPGVDPLAISHDIDIVGSGLYFRLYGATLDGAALDFSNANERIPPLTWSASRSVTGGSINPLFAISTSPIA